MSTGCCHRVGYKYLRVCGTLSYTNSFKAADLLWVAKTAERPDSEKNEQGTKEHTKTVFTDSKTNDDDADSS